MLFGESLYWKKNKQNIEVHYKDTEVQNRDTDIIIIIGIIQYSETEYSMYNLV